MNESKESKASMLDYLKGLDDLKKSEGKEGQQKSETSDIVETARKQLLELANSNNTFVPEIPVLEIPNEPIQYTSESLLGYQRIDISELPGYLFYPDNTEIWMRSATLEEVLLFTELNETDNRDLESKVSNLINACFQFLVNGQLQEPGFYKPIDRVYLLLLLRELTLGPNSRWKVTAICSCGNPSVVWADRQFIRAKAIEEWDDKYIPELKGYYFQLSEDMVLGEASWAVNSVLKKWMADKILASDRSFYRIMKHYLTSTINISFKELDALRNEWETIPVETVLKLEGICKKLKEPRLNILYKCSCGLEVCTPMRFHGGERGCFTIYDEY